MFMTIGTFINIKSFGRYKVSADGGKHGLFSGLLVKK